MRNRKNFRCSRDDDRFPVRRFGLLLLVWLIAVPASGNVLGSCGPRSEYEHLVGASVGPAGVLLTTRALPSRYGRESRNDWRFRLLRHGDGPSPKEVSIRMSGAQAHVVFADDSSRELDLTARISTLDKAPAPAFSLSTASLTVHECEPDISDRSVNIALASEFFRREGVRWNEASQWRWFRTWPDARLYAPMLFPHDSEVVLPTDFDVWNRTESALSASADSAMAFDTYIHTLAGSQPLTVYTDIQSRAGSWLMEYWFYYPFDYDHKGTLKHVHDSEHLFVEVDKLGGVRRVVGAGHGIWAPNNELRSPLADGNSISLPLGAILERGKHATAPDVPPFGAFTAGVDVNVNASPAHVWGVRDHPRKWELALGFGRRMADPRGRRFVVKSFAEMFPPETLASAGSFDDGPEFELVPLRTGLAGARRCARMSRDCAAGQVLHHQDFQAPTSILKPAMYAPLSGRIGIGYSARAPVASVGFGTGLSRLGIDVPARLSIDMGYARQPVATARAEYFLGNLVGMYSSASWGGPGAGGRRPTVFVGAFYEMPYFLSRAYARESHRATVGFNLQAGVAVKDYAPRHAWELKVSVITIFGWSHFGLKASDSGQW